jgi:hypothetical protein
MPWIAVLACAAVMSLLSSSRSLDGAGNNTAHPEWGTAGTRYTRVARPNYADGLASMVGGPAPRYVSNRIFNDTGQNLFSENRVSQWGWAWGQFLDHDFGLRDETAAEPATMRFAASDRLEAFRNDFPGIEFARTPAAPGTGVTTPREQLNTISSFIDASNVYGVTESRLAWLRAGNGTLLLPDGYLPRANARGDVAAAPSMDLMGALMGRPAAAVVAGDVRANENIALTAIHTLFAREHNRIVAALPRTFSDSARFDIARRVVAAEIQYITYNEFLRAFGVTLAPYRGYDPNVNPGLSNEFAVVGYRAHSMIHGEFEVAAGEDAYSSAELAAFRAAGISVTEEDGGVEFAIPLNVAFGNPALLRSVGVGRVLKSLGAERQYKNDEQIDNALRSVLFQVPKPGRADPVACGKPTVDPNCFTGVQDLGALDIQRGRDHGMPSYNALRVAYGLAPKRSFTAITGERTAQFPRSLASRDDPRMLEFVELRDEDGNVIEPGSEEALEDAVVGTRRTTLAARLRAVYGSVDKLDAFVGMVSERHVRGTEFGELQLAIWKKQFEALRDGDRFFYANDPELESIRHQYGIDHRRTLASLIRLNTGVAVATDPFKAVDG